MHRGGGGAFYMCREALERLKIKPFNLAMFLCLPCFGLSGCSGVYNFFFAEPYSTIDQICSSNGPQGSEAYIKCTHTVIEARKSQVSH